MSETVRSHYGPTFTKRIIKPELVQLYMYKRSLKWLMYIGRHCVVIPTKDVMLMRVWFHAIKER